MNLSYQQLLEQSLTRLLFVFLGCFVLITFLGIFLITLGFDEAWILSGIRDIVFRSNPFAVAPVISSGGFYAFVHIVITFFAANTLWIHRAFPFLCFLILCVSIVYYFGAYFHTRFCGYLVLASFLGAPGTTLLASSAYANIPVYLLVLLTIVLWHVLRDRYWTRGITCGVLAGIAAATRPNELVLLPSIVLWALFQKENKKSEVAISIVCAVVGAIVFASCVIALWMLTPEATQINTSHVASGAGLSNALFDYPRTLNRWIISQHYLPLFIIMLSTVIGQVVYKEENNKRSSWPILILFAWAAWGAWMLQTPIPHLRYLWSSLASFMLILGLGIGKIYQLGVTKDNTKYRIIAIILALACITTELGNGIRNLVYGDSNNISFEWAGQAPLDYYRRFQAIEDQREAAKYVRERSTPNEEIAVLGLDYEIQYLTGKRIVSITNLVRDNLPSHSYPKRFFIPPMAGNFTYLNPDTFVWIEHNCELEKQIGRYSFYRVKDKFPDQPQFMLPSITFAVTKNPLSAPWFGRAPN